MAPLLALSRDMAELLSVNEEAFKTVKKLATRIDAFFLVSSLLFFLDSFLYEFTDRHRTALSFDWSFAHGINVGGILLFLALFSLTMTIVVPTLIWALRAFWFLPRQIPWESWTQTLFGLPKRAPERQDPDGRRYWDLIRDGMIKTFKLRDFALSQKEHFYLLELAKEQDEYDYSAKSTADSLAYLAFSLFVNASANAFVGRSGSATFFWSIWNFVGATSSNPLISSSVQILGLVFVILILALIKPVFQSVMSGYLDRGWIYYPRLAKEEMRQRDEARENRAKLEREIEFRRRENEIRQTGEEPERESEIRNRGAGKQFTGKEGS